MSRFSSGGKGIRIKPKPILGLAGLAAGAYIILQQTGFLGYRSYEISPTIISVLLILMGLIMLLGSFKRSH